MVPNLILKHFTRPKLQGYRTRPASSVAFAPISETSQKLQTRKNIQDQKLVKVSAKKKHEQFRHLKRGMKQTKQTMEKISFFGDFSLDMCIFFLSNTQHIFGVQFFGVEPTEPRKKSKNSYVPFYWLFKNGILISWFIYKYNPHITG